MAKIYLTGAHGYFGQHIMAALRHDGHSVTSAERAEFNLWRPEVLSDLSSYDLVIHTALLPNDVSEKAVNTQVRMCEQLAKACKKDNIRLIFISSQSAMNPAAGSYAKLKSACERIIAASGASATCIRPGMIYGGTPSGLYKTLLRLIEKMPILPVPCSNAPLSPVHIDDLCQAIAALINKNDTPPLMHFGANGSAISFIDFLKTLKIKLRGKAILIPLPFFSALAKIPLPFKILDQIRTLSSLYPMDDVNDWRYCGIIPRSFGAHDE